MSLLDEYRRPALGINSLPWEGQLLYLPRRLSDYRKRRWKIGGCRLVFYANDADNYAVKRCDHFMKRAGCLKLECISTWKQCLSLDLEYVHNNVDPQVRRTEVFGKND